LCVNRSGGAGKPKAPVSDHERKAQFMQKLAKCVKEELLPRLTDGVIATKDDFKFLAR
jgi:hypothetical protein